jgi:hypothetical protein
MTRIYITTEVTRLADISLDWTAEYITSLYFDTVNHL